MTTERATTVLGIETSCDETAAAIVRRPSGGRPEILSNIVLSQASTHAPFGGVVPEIAARAHVDALDDVIAAALDAASLDFSDLDAVAATAGPGLVGGLLVGLMTGKAIAAVHNLPFVAVNHLEGHALSVRLTEDVPFPFLLLLVSGGHCQLLAVEGPGRYRRYGSTIDDAAGEAFDKAAKAMGLGYPGGPAIEAIAKDGDPNSVVLPRPLKGKSTPDFSFAGLKTAVLRAYQELGPSPKRAEVADIAASFQRAVADVLTSKTERAADLFNQDHSDVTNATLVVAGGVAANAELRAQLQSLADRVGFTFVAPPLNLCTDNGAMIAYAGLERFEAGMTDSLGVAAKVRWPLDEARAGLGLPHKKGKKGPKA